MNEVVTNNMKQIQDIIDGCKASIETKQTKTKEAKEAVKILNRTIETFTSNDVLVDLLRNTISNMADTVTQITNSFDDIEASITADKEKIKKYNKALLALQEIDN